MMPNWCANRIIVTGNPDQLTAVTDFARDEGEVSFFNEADVDVMAFEGTVQIDFDTRWAPPECVDIRALSKQFSCHVIHTFSEAGEGFCGYHVYACGEYIDSASDDLEWSEERDEYGYARVVGPEYVLGNVPYYGG
ncbi:hypothetical protein [Serratia proteamaculans]|uniref:DUF1281 family ferredoxin-like fold protein n=1 Tax=Serratia TaxID=613 RepID=UPI0013EE0F55|nr:hypothetical protein [Serratia proteamaculans]